VTADQIAQLVITALTTIWGYRSVASKLTNYVPVDLYRIKVTELHEQINGLRVQVARLEERAAK
jgi:ubiquinone biosynthesis protein UbiJ